MSNRVPVGWGSVSGGGEAVQACPRSADCGMSLPDALRPAADAGEVSCVCGHNHYVHLLETAGHGCQIVGCDCRCFCPVPAPSVERAAIHFAVVAGSAHAKADKFNARVWSSPEIRAAGSLLRGAAEQLAEGKGWGLIALQTARLNLEVAVQLIAKMEGWATNGE